MYTPLSSNVYTPGVNADVWLLGITFVEISALTLRGRDRRLDPQDARAGHVARPHADLRLVHPGHGADDARGLSAADPRLDPARDRARLRPALLRSRRAAATRCCGSTCSGCSATRTSTSSSCRWPACCRRMIPVFAGRPLVGYRAIVVAIIALAFLSFGIWVHHMFTVGIPHLALAFFSAGSAIVAVPTAVQIFAWLATLAHGAPALGRADALHLRLLLRLRDGRPDRRDARHRAVRLAGARHLFRRRPLALRRRAAPSPSRCWRRSTTGCRS